MTAADAWFGIVVFALGAYVLLDGYDLGVGILTLFDPDVDRRRDHLALIATAWDANESWLVLAGVALYGGLPAVYATVLPALYLPIIVMLFAIIIRGAAFEFAVAGGRYHPGWGRAFGAASLVTATCQGLIVGGVLSGITSSGGTFAGNTWDFVTVLAMLTVVTVVAVYALAGAAWLQVKTTGASRARAARQGRIVLPAVVLATVATAAVLPAADPAPLHLGGIRLLIIIASVLAAGAGLAITWRGLGRSPDAVPLAGVVVAEVAVLGALVTVVAPTVVPPGLTTATAASPVSSLNFLLIGVGGCLPVVLAYNAYAMWVFRGKYRPTDAPLGTSAAVDHAPTGHG